MTYAAAAALQEAVFAHLAADPDVTALLGGAIHDALPAGPLPPLYLSLGPEVARDRSDATAQGAEHEITLSVVADAAGFHLAKTAAAAVCDALLDPDLVLARGRLVGMHFIRATAKRDSGGRRRIDLTFRARLDDI
ncbi:DUF3168 domain-containing protein [Seohaeicola sp. SP36]|uniref:DUF3168 domain-containing protein n=1 Tax=unclassified Seohaeicola TaxID=2641111 RepID=UPI00237C34DF|nr:MULTISPECIES: DUF3168 domain-containing protein [unclassified Seohaeicola]MDD9706187.1 DUF3168 domain-containing protein [Seohaeicola sp. 4SK31]MDD9734646.1 DUF3168 domain-containing protein [Seohaeicola sp. SP36]